MGTLIHFVYFWQWQDELSCSKVVGEVDVGKAIETDAIPPLERLKKVKCILTVLSLYSHL
jgi:hypothetical protein